MFGPSDEQKKLIQIKKAKFQEKILSSVAKIAYKRQLICQVVRADNRSSDGCVSERSVFVQSEIDRQAPIIKKKAFMKNVVKTKNAIAFEIDRTVTRPKTTRVASDDQWELV